MTPNRGSPEKIAIIFVIGNLAVSGPNTKLMYILTGLDRRRFVPIVFVTTSTGEREGVLARYLRKIDVQVIQLNAGRVRSLMDGVRGLRGIALSHMLCVIHSFGFRSDIVCGLSGLHPRISNVRNTLRLNYQRRHGRVLGSCISRVNSFFLRRADRIVACADSVAVHLSTLALQADVIRDGFDADVFLQIRGGGEGQIKERSVRTYYTVSSEIPGKNVELVVEVFARMSPSARRLLVIGPVDSRLERVYSENPNIEFLGYVSQPMGVVLGSDFFVSASQHEGMPNAVLEALAFGRPVVLSDIPAHREILEAGSGQVGALFSSSGEALEAAIAEIEAQNYNRLSMSCKLLIEEKFSSREMVRRYENLYQELVLECGAIGAAQNRVW